MAMTRRLRRAAVLSLARGQRRVPPGRRAWHRPLLPVLVWRRLWGLWQAEGPALPPPLALPLAVHPSGRSPPVRHRCSVRARQLVNRARRRLDQPLRQRRVRQLRRLFPVLSGPALPPPLVSLSAVHPSGRSPPVRRWYPGRVRQLANLVRRHGGEPVSVPAVREVTKDSSAEVAALVGGFQGICFGFMSISQQAVVHAYYPRIAAKAKQSA